MSNADVWLHDLRQPGRTRQLLLGATYYRFYPDADGNCKCPNCIKANHPNEPVSIAASKIDGVPPTGSEVDKGGA